MEEPPSKRSRVSLDLDISKIRKTLDASSSRFFRNLYYTLRSEHLTSFKGDVYFLLDFVLKYAEESFEELSCTQLKDLVEFCINDDYVYIDEDKVHTPSEQKKREREQKKREHKKRMMNLVLTYLCHGEESVCCLPYLVKDLKELPDGQEWLRLLNVTDIIKCIETSPNYETRDAAWGVLSHLSVCRKDAAKAMDSFVKEEDDTVREAAIICLMTIVEGQDGALIKVLVKSLVEILEVYNYDDDESLQRAASPALTEHLIGKLATFVDPFLQSESVRTSLKLCSLEIHESYDTNRLSRYVDTFHLSTSVHKFLLSYLEVGEAEDLERRLKRKLLRECIPMLNQLICEYSNDSEDSEITSLSLKAFRILVERLTKPIDRYERGSLLEVLQKNGDL